MSEPKEDNAEQKLRVSQEKMRPMEMHFISQVSDPMSDGTPMRRPKHRRTLMNRDNCFKKNKKGN